VVNRIIMSSFECVKALASCTPLGSRPTFDNDHSTLNVVAVCRASVVGTISIKICFNPFFIPRNGSSQARHVNKHHARPATCRMSCSYHYRRTHLLAYEAMRLVVTSCCTCRRGAACTRQEQDGVLSNRPAAEQDTGCVCEIFSPRRDRGGKTLRPKGGGVQIPRPTPTVWYTLDQGRASLTPDACRR
jgi:hypothetical protein